jgi:metal-dependent amidase/aminoacylase/carboxypeptidase family protein
MVRARERERVDQVMARVQTCAQAAADAAGARVTMQVTKGYDDIRVNRGLAGAFRANWESLGEPVLEPPSDGKLGSVDMGNVSHVAPAIHPYIAIAPEGVAVHTYEFRDCAASPAGDRGLLLAAKGMAMTAIDLLTDAELLARIKDEFQSKAA